ncbi:uncharacterized oxidoreductase YajO [Arthrobacter sp. Hiyo1]|nr:uncharacterized oxidoreductase YajO [Arthrobacter sp. Hiyo1]
MQQRYVGNSGFRVSTLSLGTMSWAEETDEQDARELLHTFIAASGTMIDTAASYAGGRAEALLGSMLGDVVARSEVVLSTKAGVSTSDGRRSVDASRGSMLSALDASLARLGTDYVDIWFAHAWDGNVPLEETLSALDLALRSGRARYVGISNYNGWQTAKLRRSRDSPWWPTNPNTRSCTGSPKTNWCLPSRTPASASWRGAPRPRSAQRQIPRTDSVRITGG